MSKMDDLRAMREARYEEMTARASKKPAGSPGSPVKAPAAVKAVKAVKPEAAAGALCGHRAISGRTCTRDQGHSEASHRYS
jgi:hypothetical protein